VIVASLARLLRLASIVVCLIAAAYFLAFALNQTGDASNHQKAEINSSPGEPDLNTNAPETKESAPHKAIDKTFSTLSSPFSGITSGSSNEWVIHIVNTLLVLIVYGFGLAFIARLIRLGL
jgi:Na+/H+-translocating membrane pyrophosphatase